MAQLQMRRRANRVTYFVTVQTIALLGWIIVQSIFSLTLGNQIPFALTIIVEGVWWAATLVIMFFLFRREYDGFAQAVIDLEDANRKLRERTTNMLMELSKQEPQAQSEGTSKQESQAEAEETPQAE